MVSRPRAAAWIGLAILVVAAALVVRRIQPFNQNGRDLARNPDQNVLLITIDTLRGDALGCDGGPARTPNIDALAAAGLRFTFAHAHAVITLPSHASILTGTYPFQHGYRENSGYRLRAGVDTLATTLKANGFVTGAFVGAFPLDARFGLTPGFDVYDGRFDDSAGDGVFLLPERRATAVVQRATEWITSQRSGKWFAWVHVFDPHAPYQPPPPLDGTYAERPYYGEVAAVDEALGPLLNLVRSLARPTLVVLTGDHGEALGDHGETTHGLFAYESTLRVPLIVSELRSAARNDPNGAVVNTPAQHVDIMPTVLDMLEIAAPKGVSGHSLRSGAERERGMSRPAYFEAMSSMLQFGWAPLRGVLLDREKYVELPLPELYDLAADPQELTNLLERKSERQRVLVARLEDLQPTLPAAPQAEDPAMLARLQALGYVSGGAPRKARYSDADDPKRLVHLDRLLHEGVALDSEGRPAEALAKYRQLLAERPDMMSASRHAAFDYWKLGDAQAAIDTLVRALRAGSATTGAQVQLATYLSETGKPRDAIEILEPIAAAPDAELDTLNALAIAYARSGRRADALAAFVRGLKIDPANSMIHENVGALRLESGDLDAAREAFERALATNSRSGQAHAGLAMVAFRKGDVTRAIDQWKRAVVLDPSNYDALYNLGLQLIRAGDPRAARTYLEQFVERAPRALYARDIEAIRQQLSRIPR
jgi:arylsulfatase A-like enzyme/Tfp pilus assembly protein PilF